MERVAASLDNRAHVLANHVPLWALDVLWHPISPLSWLCKWHQRYNPFEDEQ